MTLRLLSLGFILLLTATSLSARDKSVEVITSPNDDRQYEYLHLDNGLRVLLISDSETDKAAASLDVHIGSADDPRDRAGLAHFLEHMLFLGTKKYPQPEEYQAFISSHGGSHNAYTSPEHTNYFFDVEQSHLDQALDRFAQFFVAPLFTAEYVERERKAVHSEYKSKIKNAYRRELDVYRHIVSQRHPMSKFSVGSLETLADRDSDSVREDLLEFYRDYYSADNMTLVVLGRESLGQLKGMVVERFGAIKRRKTRAPITGMDMFRSNFLPARVQVKPEKDERRLSLVFPVPSADNLYRQKPLQYLGNLLGHEGEGSLLSLLKDLGWVEGLSAGGGIDGRNQGTFNISMQLTPDGYANQEKVVAITFRMIQLIRERGIEKWRFEEQQNLAEIAFRFAEKGEAIHTVSQLSNQMHRYRARDIIRGRYAFDEFDGRLIRRYLKYLKPDNFLWMVTAPDVETNRVSKLYNTPYSVEQLRYEVAAVPKGHLARLELPKPNSFLPRRLQVKDLPPMETAAVNPEKISSGDAINIWFKQDDRFQVPKASIRIRVMAPLAAQGIREAALTHLYVDLLNDSLNEFAYPAALAGLNFNISANSRGFDLQLSGYNDRQGLLLSRLLNAIERNRFQSGRVERLKQELMRRWRNQRQLTPYEQLFEQMPVLLYSPLWDKSAMADALEDIQHEDVRRFASRVLIGADIKALIHGNLYRQEALKLATLIEHKLRRDADKEADLTLPPAQVVKLTQQIDQRHLQVDHRDVAAVFYQQALGDSVEDRASMMMMRQMLRSGFFHQLRTEKQLGYIVFITSMALKDVSANVYVVQSPSTPLPEVMSEIEQFIAQQAGQVESFEQHRSALLASLREAPKNLPEQSARFWSNIVSDADKFDRREQLIGAIEALTPQSLQAYSEAVMKPSQSVWLTASADKSVANTDGEVLIDDMQLFKRRSSHYSYP
jgi:secreted Zn-dependent insulinase-like peptidase